MLAVLDKAGNQSDNSNMEASNHKPNDVKLPEFWPMPLFYDSAGQSACSPCAMWMMASLNNVLSCRVCCMMC
jgi:hypothetical protein